jgi:cytochrome c biogenesis protein CcmG, thiol:disulfide interchange protein DsbE
VSTPGRSRILAVGGLAAVTALIALLVFGLSSRGGDDQVRVALEERRAIAAPGFALDVLTDGALPLRLRGSWERASADRRVELSELGGVPIVLNFWASWCDPCRTEAPVLERGWKKDGGAGVLYLGLDMQDLSGDALDFVKEFAISYPTIRDPGREVADRYGTTGIPETFFIDADGRVVAQAVGAVDPHLLELGVEAARSGRVAGILQGGDQRTSP